MSVHITAVYEKGLLRPTAPLSLEEGAQVEVIVLGPLGEGGDIDPHDTYPLLHRALREEGWDDPRMDEYNRYG